MLMRLTVEQGRHTLPKINKQITNVGSITQRDVQDATESTPESKPIWFKGSEELLKEVPVRMVERCVGSWVEKARSKWAGP